MVYFSAKINTMEKKKGALITGATGGVGKAIALGLAKMGYDLYVIARNSTKFESLKKELDLPDLPIA